MSDATMGTIAGRRTLYWPQLTEAVNAAGLVIVEEEVGERMSVRERDGGVHAVVMLDEQWSGGGVWSQPTGRMQVIVMPGQLVVGLRNQTYPEKKGGGFSLDKIVARVKHVLSESERANAERAEGRDRRAAAKQVLDAAAAEVGIDAVYVARPTEDGLVRFYEFKCAPEHSSEVLEVLKRIGVIG